MHMIGQGAIESPPATAGALLAQGATEYLVLLSAVLIIALVSISLLGFFTGSDAHITESEAYWTGSAAPFRILDAATAPSASICGSDSSGYEITVQNVGVEASAITAISIDGTTATFCAQGAASAASEITVHPGDKASLGLAIPGAAYAEGRLVSVNVSIAYSTPYLSKVQNGEKKLVFVASSTSGAAAAPACGVLPPGTKCCDFGGGMTAICSIVSGCNAAFNSCEWQVSFVCEYGGEEAFPPCDGS